MVGINDWTFESKYDLLGPEEKLLHQTRLMRADIDDIVYIGVAYIFFEFFFRLVNHPQLRYISLAIGVVTIMWGLYRHTIIRKNLTKRFEHQPQYHKE